MRQGIVYVGGVRAGLLTEQKNGQFTFDYDEGYNGKCVCLTMPTDTKHYELPYLFPFFSNLLSEGEKREFQSKLLKIDKDDDFGFLLETASYDTIGNVTVKKADYEEQI